MLDRINMWKSWTNDDSIRMGLSFQWHITDNCDQRCKHCYIFHGGNKNLVEMSWDNMQKVLNNVISSCKKLHRVPVFAITGGDPLLHKNFWDLIKELKKNKIEFIILGNPFHLTDEVAEKLKDSGCTKYQLSLDGLKETHDWFRKPGSYDATFEALKCLNRNDLYSVIMSTVSDKNIDEIPSLVDEVAWKARRFTFSRYVPVYEDKSNRLTPERYRKFLEEMQDRFDFYESVGCTTSFRYKDHLWNLFHYEIGRLDAPNYVEENDDTIYTGCHCGIGHMTILPNGDLLACRRINDSVVGNALTDDISEVWLGDKMNYYRDFDKFEKCKDCKLLAFCRGCPAVSCGTNGNFYSPDPQCWKVNE